MAQTDQKTDPVKSLRDTLRENPRIFRDHPELLEGLELEPGQETTVVALEHARSRQLERRLTELEGELERLVAAARDNDRLARHLHQLTIELLGCADGDELAHTLLEGVRQNFQVEMAGIRLAEERFASRLDQRFLASQEWIRQCFAGSGSVVLGPPADAEIVHSLYGRTEPPIRSHALMALHSGSDLVGVLGLGSEERRRYTPGMGTTYLERLAELAGALLARFDGG